jgi:hypothetical protein
MVVAFKRWKVGIGKCGSAANLGMTYEAGHSEIHWLLCFNILLIAQWNIYACITIHKLCKEKGVEL